MATILFNQETILPQFNDDRNFTFTQLNGRGLLQINELNVTRDLFDITLKVHSEQAKEFLNYSVEIKNWTAFNMKLQFTFNDPMLVS